MAAKSITENILVLALFVCHCAAVPAVIAKAVDANVTQAGVAKSPMSHNHITIADCFLQIAGMQTIRSQKQVDDLVAKNPNSAQAHVLRGHALSLDGETDGASAEFDQALRLDPHCANAYVGRSRIWMANRRYDKAFADLAEASKYVTGEQKLRVLWESAFISRENRRFPVAIEKFNECLKFKFPTDQMHAFAVLMRGETYARMGNEKDAMKDYDLSIKLNPCAISAYTSRGQSFARANRLKDAVADFSRSIQNGTVDNPLYKAVGMTGTVANAYKERARIETRLGQNELAAQDLKKVAEQQNEFMEFAPFSTKK